MENFSIIYLGYVYIILTGIVMVNITTKKLIV